MTDENGDQVDTTIKYYPFGGTRSGDVPTDKKFTGQRLDETGLYFYNARYYDATIGRFISPDTIVPSAVDSQNFDRYSYCLNNPLKYTDPSGHIVSIGGYDVRMLDTLTVDVINRSSNTMDQSMIDAFYSSEYRAYKAFRENTEDKLRAKTLEQSERVISIEFGDLGPSINASAKTEKIGDDYKIILNNNINNDMSKADDYYVAGVINVQVESNILICYPSIGGSLPHPAELVPGVGGAYSVLDAQQEYNSGERSFLETIILYDCALVGLINFPAGIFLTGMVATYDFAQHSRVFYELAREYGYPFR